MSNEHNPDNQPLGAVERPDSPSAEAVPPAVAEGGRAVAAAGRPSFPSWYDFVVLAVLFCISQMILGFVASKFGLTAELTQRVAEAGDMQAHAHAYTGLHDHTMNMVARATAAGYIAGMFSLVTMVLVYRRLRGAHGYVARFSPRGFDPALLLRGFVVMLAANVVLEPLVSLLPGTPDYNYLGRGGWALLSTIICAPLFEEFLLRGVILEAVRRRRDTIAAWLISSLCFGLAHGLPSQIVATAVIGLILGYVCIRSGSLFGGIVLHALNNALAMLLLILGLGDATLSELTGPRTYYVIYGVSAAIFLWWLTDALRALVRMHRAEKIENRELKIGN